MPKIKFALQDEMWSSDDDLDVFAGENTTSTHKCNTLQEMLRYLLIFLVVWQSAFRISSAAVTSLI